MHKDLECLVLAHEKVIQFPANTVFVWTKEGCASREYVDARIVINAPIGPKTEIPVIMLIHPDHWDMDLHQIAAELVRGMGQYPVSENVRAVPIVALGEAHYPGIRWQQA